MDEVRFAFENHILDVGRRELRRETELIPLEPQVFDLLVYVIRHRERVVSKDDLVEAVWGGRIVSDSTLTTRINSMRKALGDSGEEQRLIRTVARRGIRFVGTVTEGGVAPIAPVVEPADGAPLPLPDKPSIAVLPFQNMSDDPEQEYFSDGLTEDIITALSKWHWFFVIARNSSFTYKGRAVDVKVVGRELGARYVLEGSVRKSGGTVRVTAQLIESQNGAHIWAQRYDRDMADIFVVQDEITSQIARALDVELIEAENTRRARERPSHPEATDLVLRARALQNDIRGRSHAQILATRQLLLEALALDDTAPNLHAELARTYLNEAVYGWAEDYADTVQHASDAADRGILLYPREASAYVSKGMAHRLRGDVEKAMGSFRIALDLNPNYANAQTQVADTLTQMGRPEVGYEAAKVALRLDPRYPNSYRYIGRACFHMDRFAEAAEWLQQALQLAPNTWFVQAFLAASLVYSDRLEEAERMVAEMTRTSPIASIGKLRALELPGAPNWMKHLAMMNEALRRAGLPE